MIRIFKNVESNNIWLIKNEYYYDYKRICGNIFILLKKSLTYEN
jgi:hypothetical protein